MTSPVRPANNARHLDFRKNEALLVPGGYLYEAVGVADIDTTLRTSWPVKFRSRMKGVDDLSGLVVPEGAVIQAMGIRVVRPGDESNRSIYPGINVVCTSGDRFKLATAVGATGTQAFNASASTAYVASTAFATNTLTTEQKVFAVPFSGASSALDGDKTFTLYCDNGTSSAGSGARTTVGTIPIVVMIHFWMPPDVPYVDDFLGRYVAP